MPRKNLTDSKNNKDNEFYTKYDDIQQECGKYWKQFENKIILMPCDDPNILDGITINSTKDGKASQFWVYFHKNFKTFKLKSIIATHYDVSGNSYKIEYKGGNDSDISNCKKTKLIGTGDFQSKEIVELIKKCDIVITNPPWSEQLPTKLIKLIIEHNKKFLLLGNQNWITFKEMFGLIKNNLMWMGYNENVSGKFYCRELTKHQKGLEGTNERMIQGTKWFTNLEVSKRNELLEFSKHSDFKKMNKYDNYNAINIDYVKDYPFDYFEEVGVPITFLQKHNPKQFQIISLFKGGEFEYSTPSKKISSMQSSGKKNIGNQPSVNGKRVYARIIVKRIK